MLGDSTLKAGRGSGEHHGPALPGLFLRTDRTGKEFHCFAASCFLTEWFRKCRDRACPCPLRYADSHTSCRDSVPRQGLSLRADTVT